MKRLIALSAAVFLMAAPVSFAQPQTPAPETPPATSEPAPAPPTSSSPPVAAAPAAPAPTATPESTPPQGEASCRTQRDVGEQCSCLSAPTDFGTSTAAPNGGRNQCVVPD